MLINCLLAILQTIAEREKLEEEEEAAEEARKARLQERKVRNTTAGQMNMFSR